MTEEVLGPDLPLSATSLFERLSQVSQLYIWDESLKPWHSTYDHWHVQGVIRNSDPTTPLTSTSTISSLSLRSSISQHDSPRQSTRPGVRHQWSSISGASTDGSEYSARPDPDRIWTPVVARISTHTLRLEREYKTLKTIIKECDPTHEHVVRPIEMFKLPTAPGTPPMLVCVVEHPGMNYLRDWLDMGPAFFGLPPRFFGADGSADKLIQLQPFLDFAINACECLELLHHGANQIHGEIRQDAFHWNKETNRVRFLTLGNGPRSFENLLSSSGWAVATKEIGAKNKLCFLAPEQTGRLPVEPDSRTDIYSLGLLFWTMLTGRLPFYADTALDIIQRVLNTRLPNPSTIRIELPDLLSRIIQKMTHKQMDARYKSVSGLKQDLAKLRKLLEDGDSAGMDTFVLGTADVSSFFILPSKTVGHRVEDEKIHKVIQKLHKRYTSQRSNSLNKDTLSTSSVSGDGPDVIDGSDISSVGGGISRTTSNAMMPEMTSPQARAQQFRGVKGISQPRNSSLDISDRDSLGSSALMQSSVDALGHYGRRVLRTSKKSRTEVLMLSGPEGCGKSTLMRGIQAHMRRYGYFSMARFDMARPTPFEPMLKALANLLRQIFSERDISTSYHDLVRSQLRSFWPVLHTVLDLPESLLDVAVPSKKLISGSISDMSVLPSSALSQIDTASVAAAANNSSASRKDTTDFVRGPAAASKSIRLINTYIDVLRVLTHDKVICIALDDVHDADQESISLLQQITKARIPVILLTSHRHDNETIRDDILSMYEVNALKIEIPPLREKHVFEYVAATLAQKEEAVIPLAACVYEASAGNPYKMKMVLQELYDRNCLSYSWRQTEWIYDLDKVFHVLGSSSLDRNDMLLRKFKALDGASRCILAWASAIGFSFDWHLIVKLLNGSFLVSSKLADSGLADATCKKRSKYSEEEAFEALQHLIHLGIIVPGEHDQEFAFAHTRYHLAASELQECQKREAMHFVLAQTMISYLSDCKYSLYPIARHISLSKEMVKARISIRAPFRDVLWKAAIKSIESGARSTAREYFTASVALLQDNPWDESQPDVDYNETLELYVSLAEVLIPFGETDTAMFYLMETFKHAKCSADKMRSYALKSRVLGKQGKFELAFLALQDSLKDLGVDQREKGYDELDKEFRALETRLRQYSVEELASRPISTDRHVIALGNVFSSSIATTYWYNGRLWLNLVMQAVNVFLDQGNFVQGGLGFVMLAGAAISRYRNPELGQFYGDIGADLCSRSEDANTRGRLATLAAMFIGHISSPISNLLIVLDNSLTWSLESGEPSLAILNIGSIASNRFWAGHDVAEIEAFCGYATEEFDSWEHDMRGGAVLVSIRQLCRALQGKTRIDNVDTLIDDQNTNKKAWVTMCQKNKLNYRRAKDMFIANVTPAYFVYGYHDHVVQIGRAMMNCELADLWSNRSSASMKFYLALSLMMVAQRLPKGEREPLVEEATLLKQDLESWATVNSVNYYAWIKLVSAQIANTTCDYDNFVKDIEDAIDHCQVYGYAFEEALAYEMLAEFLLSRGSKRAGKSMVLEAMSAWSRISAHGAAQHLADKHEWLLQAAFNSRSRTAATQTEAISWIGNDDPGMHTQREYTSKWIDPRTAQNGKSESVPGMGLDVLDFSSILEFSKVISSELQINNLLMKMTAVILESVGSQAEFCAIIIDSDDRGWCVAASGEHDTGVKTYPDGISFEEVNDVAAQQITNYIIRTKETVFINNVLEDDRFGNAFNTYIERYPEGRAVIGIPILQSDHLMGVIHIEGRPNSFTERNLVVLNLLTTQVAISLGNALLYRKVRKVSAANAAIVESQKKALAAARAAEAKAVEAEKEAIRNVRLAEEAAKSKSMFLANVSHELRTPLNGVIGMSELLKGTNLTEDQDGYANSIRMCADTLLTVINDILDFSKLEAGKMQIFNVPLNLKETISEVVRALSYQNQARGLRTIQDLELPQGLVLGDPVRLHQVLLNILSNSYKFCSEGSITVKARVLSESKSKVSVECSIADTGIGITKEQLARLFKPFSQADSSTARSYGGSGLGLSICKAIVENVLGGKIWIESEPGVGTKVLFQLTFSKADENASAPADMNISAREPDPMANWSQSSNPTAEVKKASFCDLSKVPKEDLRVCIAEDNAINRKIAISFVSKLGFKCEAYEDGKLAYEALQKKSRAGEPFHLVLMDVQMPVLDGYEATKAIRKDPDGNVNQVLIIAMTASAIRGDREKCLEAGMNDYLAKPVRQNALKSLLDGYLDGTKHTQQLSREQSNSVNGNEPGSELKEDETEQKGERRQTSATNGTSEPRSRSNGALTATTNGTKKKRPSSPPSGVKITNALGRVSTDMIQGEKEGNAVDQE